MSVIAALVGPTASGKSDLAVAVAHRLGAEIVSTDAFQVYRGMDIGTAKLAPDERAGIPHHLLDVADVDETYTVARFQRSARTVVADCQRRGVRPVLVGGSALYVRAVLDQFEFPGTDPAIRARLETELSRVGSAALHQRLERQDAAAAAGILTTNGRRIVRALEVIELTGRPFSARLPAYSYAFPGVCQVGLDVPREVLDERIRARVRRMWDQGLVDEVRGLERVGLRETRTARRGLGYAQVLDFLAGGCEEDEAFEETVRVTRRFARRQDSWFRKDPRIHWVPYDAADLTDRVVALIEETAEWVAG